MYREKKSSDFLPYNGSTLTFFLVSKAHSDTLLYFNIFQYFDFYGFQKLTKNEGMTFSNTLKN